MTMTIACRNAIIVARKNNVFQTRQVACLQRAVYGSRTWNKQFQLYFSFA